MFNTLVISTAERRKRRTARFFCGTAIFYLLSVAAAFAVSIVLSNPNLTDTSAHSILMAAPAMPELSGPPKTVAARQPSQVAPRNDPTHVNDLMAVLNHPPDATRRLLMPPGPPGISRVDAEGSGPGGGDYVPGWVGPGGPGDGGHGHATAPPPRPPDPPRPAPQVNADDNRPVRLPSVVLQGKAVVRRTPDYPAMAKQIRLQGSVSVEVIISPGGQVESARAVSGHALLNSAAVEAAKGWRFGPTLLNGTPVSVTGVIVFNFKLE